MPAVEPRYAAGLLGAVKNKGADAAKISRELEDFSHALKTSAELKFFMLSPVVPAKAKKSAIKQLYQAYHGQADALTENLLCLMVDKGRLALLPGVISEFNRMSDESSGILLIKVFSSEPLNQERLDEISALYLKKYGAESAKVESIVDPSLLGGIRVQIGDMLFDASLSTKLRGLASATGAIANQL